jgi:nucleotide-binding universal stress UspA family protein
MKVETILVPTDFSSHAEEALAVATELAKTFGARIVVLHAYHLDVPMMSPMAGGYALPENFYADLQAHATARVEKLAGDLATEGVDAVGVAIPEAASLAIVDQAHSLPADLIVMGTRGNTGLKHVVLGSVAERVVRAAPCPVLTVKGDAATPSS